MNFKTKTKTFSKNWSTVFWLKPLRLKTSFPFKTGLSEANAKTNKMRTTKLTYHKEWSFISNCFIFWKICFSFRTSWNELIWCTNDPNVHIRIFIFRKRWSLILGCLFSVSILKDSSDCFWQSNLFFLYRQYRKK